MSFHSLALLHFASFYCEGISAWAEWSGATATAPRKAIVNLVGTPANKAEPVYVTSLLTLLPSHAMPSHTHCLPHHVRIYQILVLSYYTSNLLKHTSTHSLTTLTQCYCSMTREELYHEFLLPNPLAQSSKKETIAECLLSPSKARHIVVPPADTSLFVVRTPRANASLLSLKDFENQVRIQALPFF